MKTIGLRKTIGENGKRILLISSENQDRQELQSILSAGSYQVGTAETGRDGIGRVATWQPHLVILQASLDDMSGAQALAEIRRGSSLPVLMMSNRSDESEIVRGLDAGADDFLVKPFGIEELFARIRAAFRHVPASNEAASRQFNHGEIWIDLDKHVVWKEGLEVHLTPKEFDLLALLMANAGKLLTYEMILGQVWGPGDKLQVEYLRVYMSRLRKKLGTSFHQAQFIRTASQAGYLLQ